MSTPCGIGDITYDTESGLYYLGSRYYDPVVKRFINADSFASTGQGFVGYNMFAYCMNNPVGGVDPTGEMFIADDLVIGVTALLCATVIVCWANTPSWQESIQNTVEVFNDVIFRDDAFSDTKEQNTPQVLTKACDLTAVKIKQNQKRYQYWIAVHVWFTPEYDAYIPGKGISYSQAISIVKSGGSVFANNAKNAYRVAQAAGDGREPIFHSAHGNEGYYRHYHAREKNGKKDDRKGHVFYPW